MTLTINSRIKDKTVQNYFRSRLAGFWNTLDVNYLQDGSYLNTLYDLSGNSRNFTKISTNGLTSVAASYPYINQKNPKFYNQGVTSDFQGLKCSSVCNEAKTIILLKSLNNLVSSTATQGDIVEADNITDERLFLYKVYSATPIEIYHTTYFYTAADNTAPRVLHSNSIDVAQKTNKYLIQNIYIPARNGISLSSGIKQGIDLYYYPNRYSGLADVIMQPINELSLCTTKSAGVYTPLTSSFIYSCMEILGDLNAQDISFLRNYYKRNYNYCFPG